MNTATKLSLAAVVLATVAGSMLAASAADAGNYNLHIQAPYAFDQYEWIKHPGGHVELNPQPLPPGIIAANRIVNPGTYGMLNPQPLPPRYFGPGYVNPGVIAGFNPQPDPPGAF